MTTYNSKSKSQLSQSKIDELDKFINAYRVNGEDEIADGLEEIRPGLKEIFDGLQELQEEMQKEARESSWSLEEDLRKWVSENLKNEE